MSILKTAGKVHINNAWALIWCVEALHALPKITKKSLVYSGNLYAIETKLTWLVNFQESISMALLKRILQ